MFFFHLILILASFYFISFHITYVEYTTKILEIDDSTKIVVTSTSYTLNAESPSLATLPPSVSYMYVNYYQARYLAGYLAGLMLSTQTSAKVVHTYTHTYTYTYTYIYTHI